MRIDTKGEKDRRGKGEISLETDDRGDYIACRERILHIRELI